MSAREQEPALVGAEPVACIVCRRVWMQSVESGPAGLRFRCSQCGVVIVVPRVAWGKAWRKALAKGWRKPGRAA